ncbi:MAG: bifunctional DNA primase/polymerase [Candidatus Bathyarchaeia archaeon]
MQDLRRAAEYWAKLGLKIVPLKMSLDSKGDKQLTPLLKWQEGPYPGFTNLRWDDANGFAVVLGPTTNGWLACVDVDQDAPLRHDSLTWLLGKFPELQDTYIERTPHGFHLFVWTDGEGKNNINAKARWGVELHVNGLAVMAPTEYEGGKYEVYHNGPIVKVDGFCSRFAEAVGQKIEGRTKRTRKVPYVKGVRPCIRQAVKTDRDLPHLMRLAIAAEYKKAGLSDEETAQLFAEQEDYTFDKSLYQVRTADPEKAASCLSIRSWGYCLGFDCPYAPKDVSELLIEEEKQRALDLLKQDIIGLVVKYGRRRLIGEDKALICNFVAICSGQTHYPISLIISGFSGSGKNESLRAIKPLIPPEWLFEFTTATPEAVKYIPEDFEGTLLIYEAAGIQSKTGSLGLRAIGEGESIETIYPIRDEATGRMKMGRAKTNAKNFITTEADVDIYSDLYRRTFRISMNDDPALTKRVMAKKIRDSMLPESLKQLLGLNEPFNEDDFRNALRLNGWQHEVIAFPPPSLMRLMELSQTREQQVSLRTHVDKIISFAKVLALIRQADRPKVHVQDKTYMIAVPDDFNDAIEVLGEIIQHSITRLERRQEQVLQLFSNGDAMTKHEVAEKAGLSTQTAYRVLKVLSRSGYLREVQTTKPFSYELLREKPENHINSTNTNENRLFWLENLEKMVKHISSSHHVNNIEFRFDGVQQWIEKVKAQLNTADKNTSQITLDEMMRGHLSQNYPSSTERSVNIIPLVK